MTSAPPVDSLRLQAYYDVETKYRPAPVPTPLDRGAATAFVNAMVTPTITPERMRKLMRLAVFYDLRETAPAFVAILRGNESQPGDVNRSALALIALAWIGTREQRSMASEYARTLRGRADIERHRDIMREVVEAFGLPEVAAAHRQWVESAIHTLDARLRQAQAANDMPGANLAQEKLNQLTEYLTIDFARVELGLSLSRQIEALAPPEQIAPTVGLALGSGPGATPALAFWGSMRLLRLASTLRGAIADAFSRRASTFTGQGADLFRARSLRAAEYFGRSLTEPDRQWLRTQVDANTDPLVLRPDLYGSPK